MTDFWSYFLCQRFLEDKGVADLSDFNPEYPKDGQFLLLGIEQVPSTFSILFLGKRFWHHFTTSLTLLLSVGSSTSGNSNPWKCQIDQEIPDHLEIDGKDGNLLIFAAFAKFVTVWLIQPWRLTTIDLSTNIFANLPGMYIQHSGLLTPAHRRG